MTTHPSWQQDASLSSVGLTATRTKTGSSRLLAVVEGRPKQAFKTRLEAHTEASERKVEIVAMDGLAGYKTTTVEELPHCGHGDRPLPRRWPRQGTAANASNKRP